VEDEYADRVYVPGSNTTPPPARDVEPFWPPEELDAPVHGGRPVRHEPGPTLPLPHSLPAPPVPPQPPRPSAFPDHPPQATPVAAPAPATQAWPNFGQPTASDGSAESGPAPLSPAGGPEPAAADSPWSQPPQQRPAPATGQSLAGLYDDVEIQPLGSRDRMASGQSPTRSAPDHLSGHHDQSAGFTPPQQRTSAPVPSPELLPVTERAAYYPTVTPRRPPQQDEGEPVPVRGQQPPVPGEQPPVPGEQPPVPGEQPPQPQLPWDERARSAPPVVGPYPPAVDPRTASPHVVQHPQVPQPAAGIPGQPHQQVELPRQAHDPYHQEPWVSDGSAPTAEEFARRRLARPAEPVATMGPRALLQKGTMGLVKLPPGRREQEYKQDVEMVRRNFGGLRQVTVVNPKGGAGKTVAVLLLAMTFGQKRGGYVLAWDNNETQGTLGMRAQQDFHARTVRDMMRDLDLFRGSQGRVGDLSQYVRAQGEGMFDVLASDESATAGEMLTANAFAEIREIVSRFYKLIFVDTGNNVRAQNWQAAMDATDQLVITMSARNDSAETAARMLDHLEQTGRQRLVRQAISVVSMPPTRKDIDLPAIERHFAARTRAVLISPYEKLIDSGEPLRYAQLSSETKNAWLKIAAAVAEGL
jgi:MinD-like ATPase involved in chromosome partitioning or flagellar assembly